MSNLTEEIFDESSGFTWRYLERKQVTQSEAERIASEIGCRLPTYDEIKGFKFLKQDYFMYDAKELTSKEDWGSVKLFHPIFGTSLGRKTDMHNALFVRIN